MNELLSPSATGVGALTAHVHGLSEMDRRLRPLLDPALAGHCRVAAYRDGRLILAADSQGWATRLRYHTERIRENLTSAGELVRDVRVIVVPPVVEPAAGSERAPPPPLSPASAHAVETAADGVSHPPLADALRRLARNRE